MKEISSSDQTHYNLRRAFQDACNHAGVPYGAQREILRGLELLAEHAGVPSTRLLAHNSAAKSRAEVIVYAPGAPGNQLDFAEAAAVYRRSGAYMPSDEDMSPDYAEERHVPVDITAAGLRATLLDLTRGTRGAEIDEILRAAFPVRSAPVRRLLLDGQNGRVVRQLTPAEDET